MKLTTGPDHNRTLIVEGIPAKKFEHFRNEITSMEIAVRYVLPENSAKVDHAIALDNLVIPEIVRAVNLAPELLAALEAIMQSFVHVPGDDAGNKVRTAIFAKCENMRAAAVQARGIIARAKEVQS